MPIILLNKAERLPMQFPEPQPPISDAQSLWPVVKAELLAAKAVWTPSLHQLDTALALPPQAPNEDETTTIYYHRLLPDERRKLEAEKTERGQIKLEELWLSIAQAAVDAWEGLYDADLKPVPVPSGVSEEERRTKIAALVYHFPSGVRQTIALAALADSAEELKKSWRTMYSAASASPVEPLGGNSPAGTAAHNGPTMA